MRKIKPVNISGNRPHILVIDDEPEICKCLERCLTLLECTVETSTSPAAGLERLERSSYDLVITDLRMPGMTGIEVVRSVRRIAAGTGAIVLTGHGTIDTAVEAMRAGATDYLTKPFKIDELRAAIEKVLKPVNSDEPLQPTGTELIGHSRVMKRLRGQIEQVAAVASTALLHGETGVGKELVARAIHAQSERRLRPFIAVNCGAIQENLLESELFGYEKGAFTGAQETRRGKVEAANHGTLFLDEIAETSSSFQTALLRVLQEREVVRVGGTDPVNVDFRLIAATNKDLKAMIKDGTFREDLYYRLNVVTLEIPPLREHPEDIPELVSHFIKKHRAKMGKNISGVSPEAMMLLSAYRWPGNIRQLENAVEKSMVLAPGDLIEAEDLPSEVANGGDELADDLDGYMEAPFKIAKDSFERAYLEARLKEANGNISEAARKAKLARPYFHDRIRKYEIDPQQYR